MFTCPNKDLHSVYLDGELSPEFTAQYEKHVNSCINCQAQLKKMRALRSLFEDDKKNITMTANDVSSSFDRLQARLSYKRVTKNRFSFAEHSKEIVKDVFIGAAAAAVIAVVLPLRTQQAAPVANTSFQPVAKMTSFDIPSNLKLDGEVSAERVQEFLSDKSTPAVRSSLAQAHDTLAASVMPFGTSLVKGIPAETNVAMPVSLTSYDVFTPLTENKEEEIKKGFSLHFSSSLFSLDIGNNK